MPIATTNETMRISSWESMESFCLRNRKELSLTLLSNGTIGSIEHEGVLINQMRGVPPEGAPFRLWCRTGDRLLSLLNPCNVTGFAIASNRCAVWTGEQGHTAWRVMLALDAEDTAWTWQIELTNRSQTSQMVQSIIAQDLALAGLLPARLNENYTAHYIDYTILNTQAVGPVVCARQNLAQAEGAHPWLMAWCPTGAASFATDGIDVFGREQRTLGMPELASRGTLPGKRRQGESACAALSSAEHRLSANESVTIRFRMIYREDHPAASGLTDLGELQESVCLDWPDTNIACPPRSIWDEPEILHGEHPDAAWWDEYYPSRRQEEFLDGELASFFTPDGSHVVARIKEVAVERSHGHILFGSSSLLPEDDAMGATVYAPGVFGAHVYAGNPNFGRLLTVIRDSLHRLRSSGQRVWICRHNRWYLLGTPSAFVMGERTAEWWYALPDGLLHISACADISPSGIILKGRVVTGEAVSWRVTHQLALGAEEMDFEGELEIRQDEWMAILTPDPETLFAERYAGRSFEMSVESDGDATRILDDSSIWFDRQSRMAPYVVAESDAARTMSVCMRFSSDSSLQTADLPYDTSFRILSGPPALQSLAEILPWYRFNAWIHLASPHGLEQYGGGAWGVRDVCQGPVEWLLSEQRYVEVKRILHIVFSQQYSVDGLWPQWFMLGRYADIRQRHCHGDVMFWPLKALCDYAEASGDTGILSMVAGYADEPTTSHSLLEHVDKVVQAYRQRCVDGTALIAYGDGDWDDTLQPADPAMRKGMVSSWTIELAYHAFGQLSELFQRIGDVDRARQMDHLRADIETDFMRHLMPDGIVAGFSILRDGQFEPMLHPRDQISGIRYRLLPMTRGILSGLFDPAQAKVHRELISRILRYPDGVHLMDRPVSYAGGVSRLFQRAETAAYFGREVALQYVHAHLRYAETMARVGDSEEAWWALQIVNPIGLKDRLPNAAPRQSNVYFSSSDADFCDREEASAKYGELQSGGWAFKSGWRLYSSGPGLYLHKVRTALFGIREKYDRVHFDPVLPRTLLPCTVEMRHEGRNLNVHYDSGPDQGLLINGVRPASLQALDDNPYRSGGYSIDRAAYRRALDRDFNEIRITV